MKVNPQRSCLPNLEVFSSHPISFHSEAKVQFFLSSLERRKQKDTQAGIFGNIKGPPAHKAPPTMCSVSVAPSGECASDSKPRPPSPVNCSPQDFFLTGRQELTSFCDSPFHLSSSSLYLFIPHFMYFLNLMWRTHQIHKNYPFDIQVAKPHPALCYSIPRFQYCFPPLVCLLGGSNTRKISIISAWQYFGSAE